MIGTITIILVANILLVILWNVPNLHWWIIEDACRRFIPPQKREARRDEWIAEVEAEQETKLGQMWRAHQIWRGARRVGKIDLDTRTGKRSEATKGRRFVFQKRRVGAVAVGTFNADAASVRPQKGSRRDKSRELTQEELVDVLMRAYQKGFIFENEVCRQLYERARKAGQAPFSFSIYFFVRKHVFPRVPVLNGSIMKQTKKDLWLSRVLLKYLGLDKRFNRMYSGIDRL